LIFTVFEIAELLGIDEVIARLRKLNPKTDAEIKAELKELAHRNSSGMPI